MSNDWIKMRCELRSHPKVVSMASALRVNRLQVIGGLYAVWAIFDTHSADGSLPGYSFRSIDEDLGWKGFGQAMGSVEWLVDEGTGLSAPRFDEHNGQSAKRRAEDLLRKRAAREIPDASARDPPDVREMSGKNADNDWTESGQEKEKEVNLSIGTVERGAGADAPRTSKAPKTRLPENWTPPPAWLLFALEERPEWDEKNALKVAIKFRDHWLGKGAAMADWFATWRNWVRGEGNPHPINGSKPTSRKEQRADNMDDITGRKNARRTPERATPSRMDGTLICPDDGDLRQPNDLNVGRRAEG